jgi:ubiquinone/menaquinone biosynthesis C-methylase UbiE
LPNTMAPACNRRSISLDPELHSLPIGIPSGVFGKGEEHGAVSGSARVSFKCSLDVRGEECNGRSGEFSRVDVEAENGRYSVAEIGPRVAFSRGYSVLSTFERYQRIAPVYDLLELPFEYGRYRRIRRLLFDGLSGRLLDAGVGTGRNFPFYPPGTEVVGIDISPVMLARAERKQKSAAADVQLRQMDVTRLHFADRTFDAAVATFLFCVLPEELQVPALRELGRVVKTGGPVRLLEYVRPHRTVRRVAARLWEPWIAWAYGASFDRRTEEYIPEAGLELIEVRFVVDDLVRLISARAAS